MPKANQFTTLKYHHQLLDASGPNREVPNEIHYTLPDNFKDIEAQFGLGNAEPFKREKLLEVLAIADNENLSVTERKFHQYQEVYIFQKDSQKVGLSFWYNSAHKFTRIQIAANYTSDYDLAKKIESRFKEQVNISIEEKCKPVTSEATIMPMTEVDFFSDEQHKPLEILYLELYAMLRRVNISVQSVQHVQYQEVYRFGRNGETAVVQFYYDGLKRFTRAEPRVADCNSNTLLTDLNTAIEQLKQL